MPRQLQCTYCLAPAKTRDHVPARLIFSRPFPPNLPTVPACRPCNIQASKDDEYLRDTIVRHPLVKDRPDAAQQLKAMVRATAYPEAAGYATKLRKEDYDSVAPFATIPALAGRYTYTADQSRAERTVQRYIRGLYRWQTRSLLPAHLDVISATNPGFAIDNRHHVERILTKATKATIQQGVFWFAWRKADDNPDYSSWLLVFFEEFAILGLVVPEARLSQIRG